LLQQGKVFDPQAASAGTVDIPFTESGTLEARSHNRVLMQFANYSSMDLNYSFI